MARRSRGSSEDRIRTLERRLARKPASAAFFPLASLLMEQGEAARAEDLLVNGLLAHPHYAPAAVLLGEILVSKDRHAEAAPVIEKALEITPWNIQGQRLLAECRRREGDAAAARDALRTADMFGAAGGLQEDAPEGEDAPAFAEPSFPESGVDAVATPALAELYMAQGHAGEAIRIYTRLLEGEPDNAQWRARLAAIRGEAEPPAPALEGYPEEEVELIAGDPPPVLQDAPAHPPGAAGTGGAAGVLLAKMLELYIEGGNNVRMAGGASLDVRLPEGIFPPAPEAAVRDVSGDEANGAAFVSPDREEEILKTLEGWLEALGRRG